MGFVLSSTTISLDAHLTQKGREIILFGVGDAITKFALGDSDANYTITDATLSPGHVPDVTGDHVGCLISVAEGVGIKHFIPYLPTDTAKYKVVFMDDNDESHSNLTVEVNVGNMLAYMKLNDDTATFNATLDNPYMDFYKYIRIEGVDSSNTVISVDHDEIQFQLSPVDFTIYQHILSNAGYLSHDGSEFHRTTGNQVQKSTFEMTFSSLINGNNVLPGAGKGGILVSGREYGYYVMTTNDNSGTFYAVKDIEGKTSLSIPRDGVITPAAKINYLGSNYIFIPRSLSTYGDSTGSNDHVKRFGLDYETNQFNLIDIESNITKSWFNYMVSAGLGVNESGIHKVQFNAYAKPRPNSPFANATVGYLKVILILDSNSSNWDPNGGFVTII